MAVLRGAEDRGCFMPRGPQGRTQARDAIDAADGYRDDLP